MRDLSLSGVAAQPAAEVFPTAFEGYITTLFTDGTAPP